MSAPSPRRVHSAPPVLISHGTPRCNRVRRIQNIERGPMHAALKFPCHSRALFSNFICHFMVALIIYFFYARLPTARRKLDIVLTRLETTRKRSYDFPRCRERWKEERTQAYLTRSLTLDRPQGYYFGLSLLVFSPFFRTFIIKISLLKNVTVGVRSSIYARFTPFTFH